MPPVQSQLAQSQYQDRDPLGKAERTEAYAGVVGSYELNKKPEQGVTGHCLEKDPAWANVRLEPAIDPGQHQQTKEGLV